MTSRLIINEIADGIQSFTYNIYPNNPEVLQNLHKCANNFKRIYIVKIKEIDNDLTFCEFLTKIIYSQ